MSERIIETDGAENGTAQRLIDAGITLIAEGGTRGLTIRDVASRAGISFPSVQYHFPTKALLIDEVFAAIERRHCQETERLLAGLALAEGGAPALGRIVLAILCDWCARTPSLTMAVHEMLLAAYRGAAHAEFGQRWVRRQHAIWTDLVGRISGRDEPAMAWFVLELLIGLSLMSLGSENPVATGLANDEIIRYAFSPIVEKRIFDPAWYRLFIDRADSEGDHADTGVEVATHPAARKILEASIRIVAKEGSGALTFRGVATEAGVAISSITNNFHTREALIYRVYRRIQDNMAELGLSMRSAAEPDMRPREDVPAEIETTLRLLRRVSAGEFPLFVAAYDLVLAAARDKGLARQAWRIRITRGVYLLIRRGHLDAPPLRAQFRSHLGSLWTIGAGLLAGIGPIAASERDAALVERLRFGYERLKD